VVSAPNRGATFTLYFPQATEPSDLLETAVPVELPSGDETILLVEDEGRVRRLARRVLQDCGFTVIPAENGSEALRKCAEHEGRIDLLVTDVIMPGMNGRQLHEEIRKTLPDLQALYVSGYPGDVIADHGVLDEGVHFLPKPFTAEALMRKVREVLDTAE
jgi:CheY-like chemotaxis protein